MRSLNEPRNWCRFRCKNNFKPVHKEIHACERVLINVVAENLHCPIASSDPVRFTGVYNLLTCYIVMHIDWQTATTTTTK